MVVRTTRFPRFMSTQRDRTSTAPSPCQRHKNIGHDSNRGVSLSVSLSQRRTNSSAHKRHMGCN